MRKAMFIDPPSGWKYGFPKELPSDQVNRTTEWMIEQGYPREEIDKMGEHFYCRYWEEEVSDEPEKPTRTRRRSK